jgi:hypothetical protein
MKLADGSVTTSFAASLPQGTLANIASGKPKREKPVNKLPKFFRVYDHPRLGIVVDLTKVADDALQTFFGETFRGFMEYYEWQSLRQMYPLPLVISNRPAIEKAVTGYHLSPADIGIDQLWDELEVYSAELMRGVADRLENGAILFSDLPYYILPGTEVIVGRGVDAWGGVLKNTRIVHTMMGSYQSFEIELVQNITGIAGFSIRNAAVGAFAGLKAISDIPIRHVTPEEKAVLTARGVIFREVSEKPAYMEYTGTVVQPSYYGDREYTSSGRVMIDPRGFRLTDVTNYRVCASRAGVALQDEEDAVAEDLGTYTIADADLWRCSDQVLGFSFNSKKWGLMRVATIRPIEFRDAAFDQLVMDDRKKKMVRALVEHHKGSFTDIVSGKGGGCIFLLHGPPGQGKTLTAETVSELLRRPLYMVSVGELGTDPSTLEERLRQILDLATMWNAVLLLDEADIFLEERDGNNIMRNAMVGVFLRLLEYHDGILFLTTNRMKNIDKAFYSRISIGLKFDEADEVKRRKIWMNLLGAAGIDLPELQISYLADCDLNGRQIKNTIRNAQTLAHADGVPVSYDYMKQVIDVTEEFTVE